MQTAANDDVLTTLMAGAEHTRWVVNGDGTILAAGGPMWAGFAAANRGTSIVDPTNVVGHQLHDHIAGDTVRALYDALEQRVLDASGHGNEIAFRMRCDSANECRCMHITMARHAMPDGEPVVIYDSHPCERHWRCHVELFDRPNEGTQPLGDRHLVEMCSWCKHVLAYVDNQVEEWIPPDVYLAEDHDLDVMLAHGVCDECREVLEGLLEA